MANGLINLQTDLKSLKYSSMPLGSQNPYVRKDIGDGPETQIGLEFRRRIDDTSRIAQMLIDKPGINYLLSEAALQQINVQSKIERAQDSGKTLGGAILQQLGNTVINTVKIAASTLAQIPVNGTGTHLLKGFRTDTYLQPSNGNTRSAFAQFFGAGGVEGAPLAIKGQPIEGEVVSNFGEKVTDTKFEIGVTSKYDYNGEVFPDYNETKNTPKEDWASKDFYNSTLASQGKVIPVSKTEIRPVQATNADTGEPTTLPGFNIPFQQPGIETTAAPGVKNPQSSIVSISHLDSVQADIQPDSINNVSSQQYTNEDSYITTTTDISINNAQAGQPVPLNYPGIEVRESTSTPGDIGISIQEANSNSTVSGGDVEVVPFIEENQKKKSKNDTEANILNALEGAPVPLQPEEIQGVQGTETTLTPGDLKSISNTLTTETTVYTHPYSVTNNLNPDPDPADYVDGTTPTYSQIITNLTDNIRTLDSPNSQEVTSSVVSAKIARLTDSPFSNTSEKTVLADNGGNGTEQYLSTTPYSGKTAEEVIQKTFKYSNNGLPPRINIRPPGQEGGIEPYFDTYVENPTDTRLKLTTEKSEDSTVDGAENLGELGSLGERSIPVPRSLSKLRTEINTGSITPVSRDGAGFSPYTPVIQDFRKDSGRYSFDYNNLKIKKETRVNLGDQGKKKSEGFYASYSNVDAEAIDSINILDVGGRRNAAAEARDLVKFYFEIITPDGSKFLYFRAFIDSIDDSYNADWQGFNYVGRGEKFYTYGGFERDISINFKIAAATRSELRPIHNKMVYLASATAPTYGTQGFMRGTLARITIGSYFDKIPGVITSVKYSLIDDLPWEIAMQDPEGRETGVEELPTGLQCSVSFKAIHDFAPRTGLLSYFSDPKPAPPIKGLPQTEKSEEEKAQEQKPQQATAQQQSTTQTQGQQEQQELVGFAEGFGGGGFSGAGSSGTF
jgi:hypothetical protein